MYKFIWLYLANTHRFPFLVDIIICLNGMTYVHCGDNRKTLNLPVNMIISDRSIAKISFARNVRSSALCFFYVVCHFILCQIETPPEATLSYFSFE